MGKYIGYDMMAYKPGREREKERQKMWEEFNRDLQRGKIRQEKKEARRRFVIISLFGIGLFVAWWWVVKYAL